MKKDAHLGGGIHRYRYLECYTPHIGRSFRKSPVIVPPLKHFGPSGAYPQYLRADQTDRRRCPSPSIL